MSAVEQYRPGTAAMPDAHEWAHLERVAKMYAASAMCPKAFKGKPNELMVVALTARQLDIPFTLPTLNQCYVIDGKMEMMAQLKVAIAARAGWDVWFDDNECDNTQAVVHYKAPGKPERTMTYTIDEARQQGLLDEWVEEVVADGKWSDGNPKYKVVARFTISVDGVPVDGELPEWAATERSEGHIKRKDPWFKSRGAMLMARSITKAFRYAAPNLVLGLGDHDFDPPDHEVIDAQAHDPFLEPTVSAGRARTELVERYMARGADRAHARTYAALLWRSHLLSDDDPIPADRWARILTVFDEMEAADAARSGLKADAETGEIVDAETSPMFDEDGKPF